MVVPLFSSIGPSSSLSPDVSSLIFLTRTTGSLGRLLVHDASDVKGTLHKNKGHTMIFRFSRANGNPGYMIVQAFS